LKAKNGPAVDIEEFFAMRLTKFLMTGMMEAARGV
jgi:hypothetical protein